MGIKKKIKKIVTSRLKDDLMIKMDDDNILARSTDWRNYTLSNDNANASTMLFVSIILFFIFSSGWNIPIRLVRTINCFRNSFWCVTQIFLFNEYSLVSCIAVNRQKTKIYVLLKIQIKISVTKNKYSGRRLLDSLWDLTIWIH